MTDYPVLFRYYTLDLYLFLCLTVKDLLTIR